MFTPDAIAAAAAGSSITLDPGRYELAEPLHIDKPITIHAKDVTLVAPIGKPAITVAASDVVIDSLQIEGSTGCALEARGATLTLRSCRFRGPGYVAEERDGMHGVHARGGALTVQGGSFEGFDYGLCAGEQAVAVVESVTVHDNDGGVSAEEGACMTVRNVTARNNRLGVVYLGAGRGEMSDSDVIDNSEAGVILQGDLDVTVTACRVRHSGQDGINIYGKGRARLVRNVVEHSKRHGVYAGKEVAVVLIGNVISDSGRIGVFWDERASGEARHNFVSKSQANGFDASSTGTIVVRDNISLRNGYAGFASAGGKPLFDFNFGARNEQNGVYITNDSAATVQRNELVDNGTNGIESAEKSAPVLRENLCDGNAYHGIAVVDKAAPLVEDNTLQYNETHGMCVFHASRPVVRNNRSTDNECDGFSLEGSNRALLEGNLAKHNSEDGISILEKAKPVLRDNQCIENQDAAIRIIGDDAKPKLERNHFEGNELDEVVRVDEDDDDDDDDEED